MKTNRPNTLFRALLLGCGITALGATGCQSHIGGQILPSPYYIEDDVQYFAPGPEFPLSEEAAAQQAYKGDQGQGF